MTTGFTLVELLVTISLVGLVASFGLGGVSDHLARLQVEAAAQQLVVGIERGRDAAMRTANGCVLVLSPDGWHALGDAGVTACEGADTPFDRGTISNDLLVGSSFVGVVRFTANGLAIDGGTVVVGHVDTGLVRCVVMSLPLGVTRVGRYAGAVTARPAADKCRPDPTL